MQNMIVRLVILSGFLLTGAYLFAQGADVPATLATGIEPYGSYLNNTTESINLYNGNVLATIPPLITAPGRNGQSSVFSLAYNAKQIAKVQTGTSTWQYEFNGFGPTQGRWQLSDQPYLFYVSNATPLTNDSHCPTPPNIYAIYTQPMLIYMGPDGAMNEFHRTDSDYLVFQTCASTPLTTYNDLGPYRSVAGKHMQFRGGSSVTNGVLYMKNGNRLDFSNASAVKAMDTNGNYLTYNMDGAGKCTSMVDNLNRSCTFTYDGNGNLTQATVLAANGQTQTYAFGYTTLHVNTYLSDCGTGVTGMHQDVTMLQSITLPNNLSYTFTYDQGVFENTAALGSCTAGGPAHNVYTSTLKLTKITYPEGGYVSYAYNYVRPTSSPDQVDKYVTTKTRNAQDGQGEISWTLSYTADGSGNITSTQITNPDGGTETHTFTGVLDTLTRYSVSSTNLKDIARTWTWEPGDDGSPPPSCTNPMTHHNPRVTRRTTTVYLNSTTYLQSKVENDYDQQGYLSTVCTPNIQHTNDNVIETREYAYGNGTPGSLVRRTDSTFLFSTPYNLSNAHILDRTATRIVYDAGGTLQAQTNYGYDESALTAPNPLPIAHDNTNFGTSYTSRGNLTSVKNFLSTPAPGRWLTTTTTYDTCGNRLQTIDPKNNATTYDCTDNFSDGLNRNTYAYVKSTTNAANQVSTNAYNYNTGLVTSTTDVNGNTTSYTYNDIMNRKTAANYLDGGQATYTYNDIVANPGTSQYPSESLTTKLNNTTNIVTTTYFDGLKRLKQRVLTDPQGNVFSDIIYDDNCGCPGRTAKRSNPYRSGDTIYYTQTVYDTLGRISEIRPADWNVGNPNQNKTTYTYSVDMTNLVETTEIIDPAGKKKKQGYDALGRLVIAWEPDASGNYTLSTSYQYNVLDKLTTITQGGQSRTYAYDSLGRLTSETHPEWNNLTTTYQYDDDGNLTSKTDPRNITINMTYDALNRITGKTYTGDGGVTPSVTYTYDSTQSTNGKGKLTSLSSGIATSTFNYDVIGRQVNEAKTIDGVPFTIVFRNPGFETGTTDAWTVQSGVQASVVSTQAHGGTYSLSVTGATTGAVSQNVSGLTNGQAYPVSVWVRSDTGSTAQAQLIVDDTTGANSVSTTAITPGQTWQQISVSYTANATLAMRIKLNYISGSGTIYFDDVAISGGNFALSYNYNLMGHPVSITYPNGMIIMKTYNAANIITALTSSLSDVNHLASLAQITNYTAAGAVNTANYGSGAGQLIRTNTYNTRLQSTRLQVGVTGNLGSVMDISYGFNEGTSNNGAVASMTNNLDATKSANYTYDQIKRVSTAQQPQATWSITWSYDRFGNRSSQTGSGGPPTPPTMSLTIDQGTNRITTVGYSYDAVGNLTADPQHTYQYDAENRLIKIDNGSTATYWYDGYGERVKKLAGATATLYVLDVGEYSAGAWQKLYVQAAGARVEYNSNGTMYWYHMDQSRTARKVTDINGSTIATKDYWPFGEEITTTANNEKKYTGLYRDTESGFDYAVSRYYSSSAGRFLSVDKFNLGALQLPLQPRPRGFLKLDLQKLLGAPQSFDGFIYVLNNPINRIDPFGYCGCYPCTPPFHYLLDEDDGSGYDCCPLPDGGGDGTPSDCGYRVTCMQAGEGCVGINQDRCLNNGTFYGECLRSDIRPRLQCNARYRDGIRIICSTSYAIQNGESCGGAGCPPRGGFQVYIGVWCCSTGGELRPSSDDMCRKP